MSFTVEQQAAIDMEVAKQVASQTQMAVMAQQHANSIELQTAGQTAQATLQAAQIAAQAELQSKQVRLSAVQLAQSTLIANRNNQPVDAREVLASDITAYAESIVSYVNG